ncbi:MAG: hypothetical protein RBR52_07240 [Thiomonas sp.]|uniref:hypothetical protein n=1 Tax=Thiomonas sp. TaxID=2047785 RepID=UPI002A369C87|nr:hypothetical protein [Thiomonas sp.]MDY0330273.1 hypothetical protein [Thiomonas sp.]
MDQAIDYLLHYGDSDHWFFIPQARDEEDALRYFFCIEGYGQSRQFGTLRRELCVLIPLQEYLQDRDAVERRVERMRREIRARREAEEGS